MLHDKLSVAGLPKHPLRFELRAFSALKIRNTYGFNTVSDLLDGYDSIQAVYQKTLKEQLFKFSTSDIESMCHSELVAGFRKY